MTMNLWSPFTLLKSTAGVDTARLAAVDSILRAHFQTVARTAVPKFWVVEDLWQWLRQQGLSPLWSSAIAFLAVCAGLALAVWLLDFVITHFIRGFIERRVQRNKNRIGDILYKRKFFDRLLYLLPLGVILFGLDTFFRGFTPELNTAARILVHCAILFTLLLVCFSLLDALSDLYQRSPQAQKRSIKGYIQIGKLLLAFVAAILIVADILQKNPTSLLVGLGAAAAVLSLVFRDTLLGFVASIQLSAQDMVRPGDWIEMPGKKADGIVLDINLNSVKVQNWDNTVTMIPIYSMVSEGFINWRCMETSGGRRFTCRFFLDVRSVAPADGALLEKIGTDPATSSESKATIELARSSSPQSLTNLALFRAHIEVWLFRNPQLNPKMLTFARYLSDMTDKGLGFEVYAFTKNTEDEYVFDAVKRSVTEYVITCLPVFGLRLFQSPSGTDIAEALRGKQSTIE